MNGEHAAKEYDAFKSEGDLNLSTHRAAWQAEQVDAETAKLLEEDAKYFLHQLLQII